MTQNPSTVQLDGNVMLTCSFPKLSAPKSLFWFKADDILFAYTGDQIYLFLFIRNLSIHMALKLSWILPNFWPKRFRNSYLFLLEIRCWWSPVRPLNGHGQLIWLGRQSSGLGLGGFCMGRLFFLTIIFLKKATTIRSSLSVTPESDLRLFRISPPSWNTS